MNSITQPNFVRCTRKNGHSNSHKQNHCFLFLKLVVDLSFADSAQTQLNKRKMILCRRIYFLWLWNQYQCLFSFCFEIKCHSFFFRFTAKIQINTSAMHLSQNSNIVWFFILLLEFSYLNLHQNVLFYFLERFLHEIHKMRHTQTPACWNVPRVFWCLYSI